MIVYKCDKCGKQILDQVFILRAFNNIFYVDNPSKGVTYHLCVNCAMKIQKLVENKCDEEHGYV